VRGTVDKRRQERSWLADLGEGEIYIRRISSRRWTVSETDGQASWKFLIMEGKKKLLTKINLTTKS